MPIVRPLVALASLACLATPAWPETSTRVADEASAIAAAKRYTRGQCANTTCKYKARREGKQWNVYVEHPKGGHVVLYFNQDGQLVRRVQGE